MKTLINFKLYQNGNEFLLEQGEFLHKDISTRMQTSFFDLNATQFHSFDKEHYAFSFTNHDKKLLLLKCAPYNALIYGDMELVSEAARIVSEHEVKVDNILGRKDLVETFLMEYQKLKPGIIEEIHSMSIMILEKSTFSNKNSMVFQCSSDNLEEVAAYYQAFRLELFNDEKNLEEIKDMLKGKEESFYAYQENNRIASIAAKTRNGKDTCCISHVYTAPEYRGKGYSSKVVSKICEEILKENKTPYLYVDNNNPISNHLYLKLGFSYLVDQGQYSFKVKE